MSKFYLGEELLNAIGTKGPTGDKGQTGDKGSPGDKGDKGDTGDKGPTGDPAVLTAARATADLGRDSSVTVVTADPELVLPLLANKFYRIRGALYFNGDTAADVKLQLAGPSGAVGQCVFDGIANGATGSVTSVDRRSVGLGVSRDLGLITGEDDVVLVDATVKTGSTAGNLTLLWCQRAASATPTIRRELSHLILSVLP